MSRLTSAVQWLGHKRWFAALGRRLVPVDRWILGRVKGRWSIASRHGLPTLLLTTTGKRSGQPRTQPLLYATDGDGIVIVGSNWGQQHHPAWSGNLLADPSATVRLQGEPAPVPVRATLATGAERDRLWRLLRQVWPAFNTYEQRAGTRQIRIFRLELLRAPSAQRDG
jgi:deazaflavin-dependent oxidoreductase (nitroreductase family)